MWYMNVYEENTNMVWNGNTALKTTASVILIKYTPNSNTQVQFKGLQLIEHFSIMMSHFVWIE